jgi:hypothetical protein
MAAMMIRFSGRDLRQAVVVWTVQSHDSARLFSLPPLSGSITVPAR